eukprot:gnl/TRDRNA2_/TRDRNA2_89631_c0_seq2.p1 gnl/TRDRNA2_/TRDRNA2_89631_c0~~gnl/TRDRNA2_/TRDRNA2_89631_c0_seq2.p1  ORF type:complete len:427 (-),score=71.49 gnl/TRDRNA2_/TRDRNA2_89631_c0_seq2:78-1358(-)
MIEALKSALIGQPTKGSRSGVLKVGSRVRIVGCSLGMPRLSAKIVDAPVGNGDGPYSVEVYAPAVGEEDASYPRLVRRRLTGLRRTNLRPCGSREDGGLSAAGRSGSLLCSVPLEELHLSGLGPNADGHSARIGGLAPPHRDVNGSSCVILWGPDQHGLYTIELEEEGEEFSPPTGATVLEGIEEGDEDKEHEGSSVKLVVPPECLTLCLPWGELSKLTAKVPADRRKRHESKVSTDGDVVKADSNADEEYSERLREAIAQRFEELRSGKVPLRTSGCTVEQPPPLLSVGPAVTAATDDGLTALPASPIPADADTVSGPALEGGISPSKRSRAFEKAAADQAAGVAVPDSEEFARQAACAARDRKFEAIDRDLTRSLLRTESEGLTSRFMSSLGGLPDRNSSRVMSRRGLLPPPAAAKKRASNAFV